MANGPREPGVGAELIGSDTCQKYKNEFNDPDSRKISPVRYNENGNNEKLHDIEVSKICNNLISYKALELSSSIVCLKFTETLFDEERRRTP